MIRAIINIFEKTQNLFDILQKTAYLCVRAVDGAGNVGPPGNIAPVFFSEKRDRYLGTIRKSNQCYFWVFIHHMNTERIWPQFQFFLFIHIFLHTRIKTSEIIEKYTKNKVELKKISYNLKAIYAHLLLK